MIQVRPDTILCPYCDTKYQSRGESLPVQDREGHWMVEVHRCPSRECWGMVMLLVPTSVATTPIPGGMSDDSDEDRRRVGQAPRPARSRVTLWPKTSAPYLDPSIPKPYADLFREAWDVQPISSRASAALSRRCLQQLLHEHFKIKSNTLADELDQLIATKRLPSHVNDDLHAVRSVGNFAAHPQKDLITGDIVDPEPGEAEWLLSLLQAVFDSTFVEPARHAARKQAWNVKAKSAGKPAV